MDIIIEIEKPISRAKKLSAILIVAGIIASALGFGMIKINQAKAEPVFGLSPIFELATVQENSFLPISNPTDPIKPAQKIKMVITAYSSTPWETDNSPFITASGSSVREGVVANNFLPFGTQIRIPELYGEKIFVVEDRMSWKKSNYQLDIWFPEYLQAKNFGAKRLYVEVLEN